MDRGRHAPIVRGPIAGPAAVRPTLIFAQTHFERATALQVFTFEDDAGANQFINGAIREDGRSVQVRPYPVVRGAHVID